MIATAAASKLGELRALKKRRKPSAAYFALTADSAGEPKAAELTHDREPDGGAPRSRPATRQGKASWHAAGGASAAHNPKCGYPEVGSRTFRDAPGSSARH